MNIRAQLENLKKESSSTDKISTTTATDPPKVESSKPAVSDQSTSVQAQTEIMLELESLRKEGWKVDRLERIINRPPDYVWKEFALFLDDVDELNQIKKELETLPTDGFEDILNSILESINDPDLLPAIRDNMSKLRTAIKGGSVPQEDSASALVRAQDMYKNGDIEGAVAIYQRLLEQEPTNKKAQFYLKRAESKLGTKTVEVKPTVSSDPAPAPVTKAVSNGKEHPSQATSQTSSTGPAARDGVQQAPLTTTQPVSRTSSTANQQPPIQGTTSTADPNDQKTQKPPNAPQSAPSPSPMSPQVPPSNAPTPVQQTSNNAAESPEKYEALGFKAQINEDYTQAIGFYERALAIDPTFAPAMEGKEECIRLMEEQDR